MTSNHVNTFLVGNYKINDVDVDIYFTPRVIEAYASNEEISLINKLKIGEKYDRDPLEMHFDSIFEIVKLRVLELKTYKVYFDNIEYEGNQLIWKSYFDEKSKLMEIAVTYSQTNCPDYQQKVADALQEFWDAEERGEDMDQYISRQFEANKDKLNMPKLVGLVPSSKNTLH
jgi:hypothetical protein